MVNGPCQLSRQSSFSAAVSPAGLCECKFASSRTVLALERLESVASSCTMALPVPWCLSRRARRDYRLGEVRRALPEGGGFPQPNTGGSSGDDAGPRGKRLVRKKPPAHRVNQKPPGASDADATRAYLAGENQIRCATSGIRRTALRVSADPASAHRAALPAQVQGPAPQPRPARTAWPDARLRAHAAPPAQAFRSIAKRGFAHHRARAASRPLAESTFRTCAR